MPCENKCRAMSAARCPQVKHFLGRQRLTVKSEFFKPFSHQRLTAIILGGELAGIVSATSLRGDGSLLTGVSAGKFVSDSVGIVTNTPVGVQTSTLDDKDLTGIGNSFKGLYIGNGMVIHDSELTGTHYIGTSFRGMMAGPVTIGGTLTVDGNYVVV